MVARRPLLAVAALLGLVAFAGCGTDNTVSPISSLDSTPPSAPANVRSEIRGTSPVLMWDASSDADVVGYDVYVYNPDPARENAYVKLNSTPVTSTEYLVTDAPLSGTWYRVKAVDSSSNRSASSGAAMVSAPDLTTGAAADPADPNVVRK